MYSQSLLFFILPLLSPFSFHFSFSVFSHSLSHSPSLACSFNHLLDRPRKNLTNLLFVSQSVIRISRNLLSQPGQVLQTIRIVYKQQQQQQQLNEKQGSRMAGRQLQQQQRHQGLRHATAPSSNYTK